MRREDVSLCKNPSINNKCKKSNISGIISSEPGRSIKENPKIQLQKEIKVLITVNQEEQ